MTGNGGLSRRIIRSMVSLALIISALALLGTYVFYERSPAPSTGRTFILGEPMNCATKRLPGRS